MVRQNKGKTIDEFVKNTNSPLEHLFGNHQFCDSAWCNTLKAQLEGKVYTHPLGYYDKTSDVGKKCMNSFLPSPKNMEAHSIYSKACIHLARKPMKL